METFIKQALDKLIKADYNVMETTIIAKQDYLLYVKVKYEKTNFALMPYAVRVRDYSRVWPAYGSRLA